ncbi:hypothetical protein Nepgr_012122 [Nepenthes gracilis]|uniref:Uncharacterized protein n=1 Tax=Nepenthes gracilis TaxID=150966 RepID=A0AAD3SGF4_NEPGR|nr:hypothetical protein Nepgr_012122 [Nepenthes gracilis]
MKFIGYQSLLLGQKERHWDERGQPGGISEPRRESRRGREVAGVRSDWTNESKYRTKGRLRRWVERRTGLGCENLRLDYCFQ